MRMASRGPSSSSTTSTRGSVMPEPPLGLSSLMGSRQRQDEADLALLAAERQGPAVGLDDLLGHARTDVEQLVRGDRERAEQVLSLGSREVGGPSRERQANPVGVVRRRLQVDGHASIG